MAEPLSLIASLIALAQISGEVVSLCYSYRTGIKSADANVIRLASEVKSVRDILENMIKVVDEQPTQDAQLDAIALLAGKDGPLSQALGDLEELQIKLKPASGLRAVGRLLKWPLAEPEVVKTLARIDRLKTTLVVAASTDHLKIAIAHRTETEAVRGDTKSLLQHQDTLRDEKSRKAALTWLDAPSVELNLNVARSKRCAMTGMWVADDPRYKQWLDTPQGLLWVCGIPGCGKTILSACVVDDLLSRTTQSSQTAIAYFFISENDFTKRNIEGFLKCVLFQLVSKSSAALQKLKSHHRELTGWWNNSLSSQPTEQNLLQILKEVLMEFQVVYIVIDALDESSVVEEFLHMIRTLKEGTLTQLHLLVTSRHTRVIAHSMESLSPLIITLEPSLVQTDIQTYIESSVAAISSIKHWPADLSLEVRTELTNHACGMFRWVECQLDSLRKCIKPLAVRRSLRSLPVTLDETYETSILKISEELLDDARILLECMIASFRPLRLQEISEVLAFDWETSPHFHPNYRLSTVADVLLICGDFLIAEVPQGEAISSVGMSLAHSSVRDFLLSERRHQKQSRLALKIGDAHTCIAKIALVYLLTIVDEVADGRKLCVDFPLSEYAARYWIDHYHAANDKASLAPLAIRLFDKTQKHHLINWTQLYDIERPWVRYPVPAASVPPIYYASCAGLSDLVSIMLQSGESPSEPGGVFGFPLQVAAYKGHQLIVRLLLEAGADPNRQGGRMSSALLASSTCGHTVIVKELLAHGAGPNGSSFRIGTCLYRAAKNGHLEVVRLLLDAGANPHKVVGKTGHPLGVAVSNGHMAICNLLLERGGRKKGLDGISIFQVGRALSEGHTEIVEWLFDNGIQQTEALLEQAARVGNHDLVKRLLKQGVRAASEKHHHPLGEAATGGTLNVVEELLLSGADIDAHDAHTQTPLSAAAANGHIEIVRKLLDHGASKDFAGEYWAPALHSAAYLGHTTIVEMLLTHEPQADVHAPGAKYSNSLYFGSVLHNACFSGNLQIVNMVLEKGADVNATGGTYEHPIQAAVRSGNPDVVELLLERGALINVSGGKHGSPLETAAHCGFHELVNILINYGADVNLIGRRGNYRSSSESSGGTPSPGALVTAAQAGYPRTVSRLLEAHEQTGVPYFEVKVRAFEAAVLWSRTDCVRVFLDHGMDPNVQFLPPTGPYRDQVLADSNFATRQAGRNGDIDVMRTLAMAGADINGTSADGWTALHEAAREGHFRLIITLLDDLGADPHPKLINGSEPIHLAAEAGHDTCLRVLLARGVDANVLNPKGLSPLHIAANKGRWQLIPTLISHGADPTLKDSETFLTALDVAEMVLAERGHGDRHIHRETSNIEKTVEALKSAMLGYRKESSR